MTLSPRRTDDPSSRPLAREYSERVAERIRALSPYERFVITRLFGLGTAARTPRQIAAEYNDEEFSGGWEIRNSRSFRDFGGAGVPAGA